MNNNEYGNNYENSAPNYGAPQYSAENQPGYSAQQPQYTSYTAPQNYSYQPQQTAYSGSSQPVYASQGSTQLAVRKKPINKKMIFAALGCILLGLLVGLTFNAVSNRSANKVPIEQTNVVITVADSPVTDNDASKVPEGEKLTYAQIASSVRSAVVGITVYSQAGGWGNYTSAEGSGFIISDDGYVVTNSHVIGDDDNTKYRITVTVTGNDGESTEYEATVVGYDTRTDLAVLKFDPAGAKLVTVTLGDSTALVPGDEVVAIGNPGGAQFAGSITNGIVSGVDRVVDDSSATSDNAMKYIQTNAAINPGNSGGPLLNMYGQVIGINSSKIVASGYEGLGFAIPMNSALPIIQSLIRDGAVIRPVIGITCAELGEQLAQWYDVPQGLLIRSINSNSGLNGTQVQVGDIITACDGQEVKTLSDLQSIIESKSVGDTVELTIYRAGSTDQFKVTVELISDKAQAEETQQQQNGYSNYFMWP